MLKGVVSQLQGYDLLPTIRMNYETKRYEFEKLHRPIGEYIDVPSPLSQHISVELILLLFYSFELLYS